MLAVSRITLHTIVSKNGGGGGGEREKGYWRCNRNVKKVIALEKETSLR